MMRNRIAFAVVCVVAAARCTSSPSDVPQTFEARGVPESLSAPPGATGNGPYAMVVCQNQIANDCGFADISAATLNDALTPPPGSFATATFPLSVPFVHSWSLGREINFWSYTGQFPAEGGAFAGPSGMDLDDRSMFPGATPASNAQFHFTRLFTGFLALPPGPGPTTRTFAIAADDGYSFLLGGTTATGGLVPSSDFLNHSIAAAYAKDANVFDATFSDTVQLYPFALAAYQNTGTSGVEFAWASGAKVSNTRPSFDGKNWSSGTFSLVPRGQMYSPDVRATLRWSGTGAAGKMVTFHAVIENVGPVPAFAAGNPPELDPANGGIGGCENDGLCFTLALPINQFDNTSIVVNGSPVAPAALTMTSENILVPVSFHSAGGTGFSAGDAVSIDVAVAIAPMVSGILSVQGRVTGHATDPSIFGAGLAPPYSLDVLTNDPTLIDTGDSGNRPGGVTGAPGVAWALGGFSPEGRTGSAFVPVIPSALGGDDDDPTLVVVGQAPPATPRISAPIADVSSVIATTIGGSSSPVRAQNAIRVDLVNADGPGITQAQCTGFAGSWAWDAAASRCACATSSDALGGWSCSPVALPDCAVPSARCFTATASVGDLTGSAGIAPVSSAFGVRAPLASVVSRTVNSHVVVVSGTAADGVGGSAANRAPVHVVLLGPNGFSATCDPLAAPAGVPQWSCPITLSDAPSCATAPCIVDGAYAATASVREANGLLAGTAIGSYTVDTRPTAFAAPALTNNPRPPFSGHKVGDGPEIRVCAAGAPCTAASALCRRFAAPANWTCIPTADMGEGAHDAVAYEVDASGALSAPSAPVTSILDFTAPGRPLVSAPADGTFTKETSPALQIAAAEAGGSITVSVLNQAGAAVASCLPEPVPAGKAISCVPTNALADGAYNLRAVQTDAAGNASPAGTSTLHVKTRTAAPLFAAPVDGGTLANPVRIEGTAEAGATLAVKVDDGAPVQATADASGHFSVAAGVISTGSHFVQATATDFLGNTAQSDRVKFSVGLGGNVAGSSFGCSSAGGSGTFGALLLLGLVPLLGRRRKGAALAVALVAATGAARADGTDLALDNFRPASGGDGLIGVEGARPPNDGETPLELRGLLVGQSRPLVFIPDGGGPAQALIRNRVGGWLTAQGHVAGPFSLALQLPFLVQQRGDLSGLPSNVTGGAALAGGLGDLRATVRAGLLRQERALFDLAIQASAELPTAKEQRFLGDGAVHGEALVAAGYRVAFSARSALDLLGNAFFRVRPSRDVLGVKAGNEVGLRAGLAWLPGGGMLAPERVILEAEGASFLRSAFAEGSVPAEWRGGVSYCVGPMAFDFGVGGGLAAGVGTPGLRLIGGVGYEPSLCGGSSSRAPSRPPVPIRLVEATRSAAQPETNPDVSSPSTATATPPADEKPAPAGVSSLAGLLPLPQQKPARSEDALLPLPTLPPLPAAKPKKKRVVAQAEPMPDLPSPSALPLPAPAPFATLSGDRVELLRPVAFRGSRLSGKEPVLDEVARLLSRHPEIELVAISAPDTGRAQAVIAYLRKRGVAPTRLRPEGKSAAVELRILRQR